MDANGLTISILILDFILAVIIVYILRSLLNQNKRIDKMISYFSKRIDNISTEKDKNIDKLEKSINNDINTLRNTIENTTKLTNSDHDVLTTIDGKLKSMSETVESLQDEIRTYYKRKNGK